MEKNKVQLINFNSTSWEYMKDHIEEIGEFLSTYDKTPSVAELIVLSVRLILSEVMLYNDIYKKYPAVVYTDEDFVDMVIESMETTAPDPNDLKANDIYFDDMRRTMWGHIKTRISRLFKILGTMSNPDTRDESLSDEDANVFVECLMVVWVECILRKRESQLLERAYGQ